METQKKIRILKKVKSGVMFINALASQLNSLLSDSRFSIPEENPGSQEPGNSEEVAETKKKRKKDDA